MLMTRNFVPIGGYNGCSFTMKKQTLPHLGCLTLNFCRGVLGLLVLSALTLIAAPDGSLSDTNIKYFGRWDFSNPSQYVSYWGGAYIRVNFSGTTIKVKLGNTSNFY